MSAEVVQYPSLQDALIKLPSSSPKTKDTKNKKDKNKNKKDKKDNKKGGQGSATNNDERETETGSSRGDTTTNAVVASSSKGKEKARPSTVETDDEDINALLAELAADLSSGSSDSDAPSDEDEETKNKRKAAKREWKNKESPEEKTERRKRKDAEDQRTRVKTHNEGIVGFTESRKSRTPPAARPAEIEKIWKNLYPLVRSWWEQGGKDIPRSHLPGLKQTNDRIIKYCMKVEKEKATEVKAAREAFNQQWPDHRSSLQLANPQASDEELKSLETAAKIALKEKLGAWTLEELQTKYQFPTKFLHSQIYALGMQMAKVTDLPSMEYFEHRLRGLDMEEKEERTERGKAAIQKDIVKAKEEMKKTEEARTALLQGTLIFVDQLYTYGIDSAYVISAKAQKGFQEFVKFSKGNEQLYRELKAELAKPSLEQLDTWEAAALPIFNIVEAAKDQHSMRTSDQSDALDTWVETIKVHNSKIMVTNKRRGLDEDVNTIPMALIDQIRTEWRDGNDEQIRQNIKRFMKFLRDHEHAGARSLVQAIDSGVAPKLLTHPRAPSSGTPAERSSTPAERSSTPAERSGAPAERSGASPLVNSPGLSQTTHLESSVQGRAATVERSTRNVFNTQNLLNYDINSFAPRKTTTQKFDYEAGETEFGPLVATRPSNADNPRFSRFFVNTGLEEEGYEYIRVLRGSELAPGGAEQLDDQKVVDFDLRQRKKDIKSKKHPIDDIGPAVPMEHAEGYVPKGKSRRMDLYIRVTYRGREGVDFLTRTEFTQLTSKTFAELTCRAHLAEYERKKVHMEACRAQRKHPITRQSLTEEDFENTPWLFPDEERRLGFGGENEDESGSEDDSESEDSEESEDKEL
jgi:hypothetical protein